MAKIRRLLKLVAAAFGGLLYLWYGGVRNAPEARRRRRARHGR
jgi:hypothetical protein